MQAGATTPEAAIERFVAAEVARDTVASFALLSEPDRAKFPNPASWQAAHRNLPELRGFAPKGRGASDNKVVEIVGIATLVPELSEIKGLVAPNAQARFTAVAEQGGWYVSVGATILQPILPDDADAGAQVRLWLDARRACAPPVGERPGGLVGIVGLANRLCGATGDVAVEATQRLRDTADLGPFLAAFGPEVGLWARVVPVRSPVPLRAVVAPLGDNWTVVGILAP